MQIGLQWIVIATRAYSYEFHIPGRNNAYNRKNANSRVKTFPYNITNAALDTKIWSSSGDFTILKSAGNTPVS